MDEISDLDEYYYQGKISLQEVLLPPQAVGISKSTGEVLQLHTEIQKLEIKESRQQLTMIGKDDNVDALKKQVRALEKQIADQDRKNIINEKKQQKDVSKYKMDAEKEKIEKESLLKERSELEDKVRKLNIELAKKDKDKKGDDPSGNAGIKKEMEKLQILKPTAEQLAELKLEEPPPYMDVFRNWQSSKKEAGELAEELEKVKKGAIDAIVEKEGALQAETQAKIEAEARIENLEKALKENSENQPSNEAESGELNAKLASLEEELKTYKEAVAAREEEVEKERQELQRQIEEMRTNLSNQESTQEEILNAKVQEASSIGAERLQQAETQFKTLEKQLISDMRTVEDKVKEAELKCDRLQEENLAISAASKEKNEQLERKWQQKVAEMNQNLQDEKAAHSAALQSAKSRAESEFLELQHSSAKQIESLYAQIDSLNKQSETNAEILKQTQQKITESEQTIVSLNQQLQQIKQEQEVQVKESEAHLAEQARNFKEETTKLISEVERLKVYEEKFHEKQQSADNLTDELKKMIRDRRSSSTFSQESEEKIDLQKEMARISAEFQQVEELNQKYELDIQQKNSSIEMGQGLIHEAEKKLSAKIQEVVAKDLKIEELTNELNQVKTSLKEKDTQIQKINEDHEESKKEQQTLLEESEKKLKEEQTQKVNTLTASLASCEAELKELRQKLTAFEETKRELAESQASTQQREKNISNQKELIENLKEQVDQAHTQWQEKENQLNNERSNLASLKSQLLAKESGFTQISDQLTTIQRENAEKDAKIKELDGKIKSLTEKDLHNAEELKDLRVKAAKVSQLEDSLNKKTEQLEKQKAEKKEQTSELEVVRSELSGVKVQLKKLGKDKEDSTKQQQTHLDELEAAKQSLQKQLQTVQSNLAKKEATLNQLEQDQQTLKQKLASKDSENLQLQEKLHSAQINSSNNNSNSDNTTNSNEEYLKLQASHRELEDSIETEKRATEEKIYELNKQINALNVELKQLKLKISSSDELFMQEKAQIQAELDYAESAAVDAKMSFAEVSCERDYYQCCYMNLCKEYNVTPQQQS